MKAKKFLSLFMLLTALLVSCSSISNLFATPTPIPTLTPTVTPTPSPTPFPLYGKSLLDVTYCLMDTLPQKLDIYLPDKGGPWPLVIYVHGGSWMNGDKAEAAGLAKWLNPLGYAVASLNYRMFPSVRFPSFIQDTKCGVRFLRAHAAEYNLDPDHFAAWGASAGGHIVAMLGVADPSAGWDVGQYTEQSSRVQAVIDMSGPANLSVGFLKSGLQTVIFSVFGMTKGIQEIGSPVTYATADDPPFLIIHGDQDPIVPVGQGQAMYDALIKAGVSAKLVIVKNGLHDLTAAGAAPTVPTQEEIARMELDFLASTLMGK
jgi:acetyl esterase/lipase